MELKQTVRDGAYNPRHPTRRVTGTAIGDPHQDTPTNHDHSRVQVLPGFVRRDNRLNLETERGIHGQTGA